MSRMTRSVARAMASVPMLPLAPLAIFTGQGPNARDYRRGATLKLEKGIGAKFVELAISDRASKQQPEFLVREWE